MEILLLGIYAFFAWLVFFKFKWLPWNITSQVITVTIPIIGITALILVLNIAAPSSPDVRVMNYVVPINPRVAGKVIEVPVEPNKAVKKGDKVSLVGFGAFSFSKRKARTGRNPKTGATIKIAARKSPKFSAGKAFKDAVNK